MKFGTVGVLAATAMGLVSLAVWSMTGRDQSSPVDLGPEAAYAQVATDETCGDEQPNVTYGRFDASGTLMVEGRIGHQKMYADQDNDTYLYVNVRAAPDMTNDTAAPLNVAIVIDRSGSMMGKRLANALAAARGMVRNLRDGDAVSVITYNTTTKVIVPVTTVDSWSRRRVIAKIDRITAMGDTCISCAIDTGIDMARQRSGMVNRILLLSDGEATAGVRDVEGFRRIAAGVRRMGVSITSIGVDVDYNEQVMTAVAQESNGQHYFVENALDLPEIFERELSSLVRTVAKQAELRVELGPDVEVLGVFDRSYRRDGDTLIVPLGTFAATDNKTLLVRLRVPQGAAGNRDIADVQLGYEDLTGGGQGSLSGKIVALMTNDPADASSLDPLVAGRLCRSETAATLKHANQMFASGKFSKARVLLNDKLSELKKKRQSLPLAAPSARRAEVEKDLDRQLAALNDAHVGFNRSMAPNKYGKVPARPQASRPAKTQVRRNAADAFSMGF